MGVFVSNRPVGAGGGGVLVSPTRDQLGGSSDPTPSERSAGASNGNGVTTTGTGAEDNGVPMMPRFSPVHDSFVKKPLW